MKNSLEFDMKLIPIILLLSIPLSAQPLEFRGGFFIHDVADWWGHQKKEAGFDINGEVIVGAGWIRPAAGMNINSQGYTSKLYGGVVVEPDLGNLLLGFSFGGAVHTGGLHGDVGRKLGSRLLFRVSLEVGWKLGNHRLTIMIDHISNAGLAVNAGLDVVGFRYGYSFEGR